MKIAVSGLNNTDNPAPGIPVIKSLSPKHEIIGLSYDVNEPGNYMGLCQSTYLMPYPSLGIEELKKRLYYIQEREHIDAIIPNLDAELPLYIKYQSELEKEFGFKLCLPSLKNFELRNKNMLAPLSEELGIHYPRTFETNSVEELVRCTEDLDFPLMIKGNYYKAHMAHNLESAIEYFYKISNEWGFPVLIQEVVHGEELNLVGVGDGKGELKGAVAIKKLTTTEIGKIWTGVTIENRLLMDIAQRFVRQTGWRGPFEIECIMSGENHVFLIEINPRFPAWIYFATELGVNLPEMLVSIMEGEDVPSLLEYPQNKLYVRYTAELVTDFTNLIKLLSSKELSNE